MAYVADVMRSLVARAIGEPNQGKIGGQPFYRSCLAAFSATPGASFDHDLTQTLMDLFFINDITPASLVVSGGGAPVMRIPAIGEPCLWWDGHDLQVRPHPGPRKAYAEEYELFAAKVLAGAPEGATILELGSGMSAATFHIFARGRSDLRYVNVEGNLDALTVGALFAKRHGIPIDHVLMDIANSLDRPEDMEALKQRLPPSAPLVVITQSALFPYYSNAQIAKLFRWLIDSAGAVAGVHVERRGHNTEAFRKMRALLPEGTPRLYGIFGREEGKDPFPIMKSILGLSVAEEHDLIPHFLNRNYPSYLRWSRK